VNAAVAAAFMPLPAHLKRTLTWDQGTEMARHQDLADLTGIDIMRHAALNIYADTQDGKFFPPELLSRMVTAGDLGRKSGQGFYRYDG